MVAVLIGMLAVAACRQLQSQGVRITAQPQQMPWGVFASFMDLDGN